MRRHLITFYLFIASALILGYELGIALFYSLFHSGVSYVTKTSFLLVGSFLMSFIGMFLAIRHYQICEEEYRQRIIVSLVGHIIFALLSFLLLLEGALIV